MVRIEAGAVHLALEPVDLTDAVASAAHDLRGRLTNHPLELDVSPDLPLVRVDPQLFHHCLINLLDNAGKYAEGTPITIRGSQAGRHHAHDHRRRARPAARRGGAVFETFTRLDGSDRKGGTGLGLAIVKGFAEAMGLGVTAANRDDDRKGAFFTIQFPESHVIRERPES